MVDMDVKDSEMCCADHDAPRVMFPSVFVKPSVFVRPRMLCIMDGLDQRDSTQRALVVDSGSGICRTGFSWVFLLALFSLRLSLGPRCLHLGWYGPEGQLCLETLGALVVIGMFMAGFAEFDASHAVFPSFVGRPSPDCWEIFVLSAMLGSTVDTIFAAVYGAFAAPRT